MLRIIRIRRILSIAFLSGCAYGSASQNNKAAQPESAPLASHAGRPVLVLPIQNNPVFSKSADASAKIAQVRAFRSAVDDSIAAALSRRGVSAPWTFAPTIIASARRNTGMVADPSDLAIGKLRSFTHAGDDPISEPLASQIRGLVALREGRYALLPATIYFDEEGSGTRVTLLLYLIDTRTARITWSGFARSDIAPLFSGALAQSTAEHVADLVVPR